MSDVLNSVNYKNNKQLLTGSIVLGVILFGIMEIIFYFTFIVLNEYSFNLSTFLMNMILTCALGVFGGTYMWIRKLKRDCKAVLSAFFIAGIIFIACRFIIGSLAGINSGEITPYSGTLMAFGNLGYLMVIDMVFLKFMPKFIKRRNDK